MLTEAIGDEKVGYSQELKGAGNQDCFIKVYRSEHPLGDGDRRALLYF